MKIINAFSLFVPKERFLNKELEEMRTYRGWT
jgi:hypothetical protein